MNGKSEKEREKETRKDRSMAGLMKNSAGRYRMRSMNSPIGELCLEADEEGITSLYIKGMGSDGRKRDMEVGMKAVGPAVCESSEGSAKREGSAEEAKYSEIDATEKTVSAGEESENAPEAEDGDCTSVRILNWACRELSEYFAGTRTTFTVPLHLQGTEFQLKAWNALRSIPYGETRSYSEIAEMIGNPKACRAVGGANNKNPVMLFVPCHRVVGKSGALVGFTGGLDTKKYLLEMERGEKEIKMPVQLEMGSKEVQNPEQLESGEKGECEAVQSGSEFQKQREESGQDKIAETALYRTKADGEYTLEDYYALPEERRVELIDGVFYDMAAPTSAHQTAVFEIAFQMRTQIGEKKGKCRTFISPLDVQLDCDDRTMVQPDVIVICNPKKIYDRGVFGAPDLAVEVLSESSRIRDTKLKFEKYRKAGVREYWIVDLKRKKILVYEFEKSEMPVLYGVDAQIPVGIFGGECVIDFALVYKSVEMLQHFEEDSPVSNA